MSSRRYSRAGVGARQSGAGAPARRSSSCVRRAPQMRRPSSAGRTRRWRERSGWPRQSSCRRLTRLTARTSEFFVAAFSASALFEPTRSTAARFLVINRRHIGLAFAPAHFIHLGVLVAYFAVTGEEPGLVRVVGGRACPAVDRAVGGDFDQRSAATAGAELAAVAPCGQLASLACLPEFVSRPRAGRARAGLDVRRHHSADARRRRV